MLRMLTNLREHVALTQLDCLQQFLFLEFIDHTQNTAVKFLHHILAVVLADKNKAQVRLLFNADEYVQLVGLGHTRETKRLKDRAGILEMLIVRDQVVVDQLNIFKDYQHILIRLT